MVFVETGIFSRALTDYLGDKADLSAAELKRVVKLIEELK